MKQLKKPTLQQKLLLSKARRTVSDYKVVADMPKEVWFLHKYSTKIIKIPKSQIKRELVMV
jgi:hypothetical protein